MLKEKLSKLQLTNQNFRMHPLEFEKVPMFVKSISIWIAFLQYILFCDARLDETKYLVSFV